MKKLLIVLSVCLGYACSSPDLNIETQEPVKPPLKTDAPSDFLSPEESMKTFNLPQGYKLELVASESILCEPVAIAWDGNGKMFVAEMRTYMQDIDGTGTREPIGRIITLEDTDGDGSMDRHAVFIDSLVLPRMILPLDDRLLVNETYTYDLWSYRDTNGDGIADEKTQLLDRDEADNRNLEHQASGLLWNLDNWIYTTTNPSRLKFVDGKIVVDSLGDAAQGQWGLANDDFGRLYFSSAGGEVAALGFQENPAYGNYRLENQLEDDFDAVWPIVATPDVQGGPKRLRPDSTLNHFTASCGQSIFQGDHLPNDMRGDLFICEPVGRLIRRAKVVNRDGQIYLQSAYREKEFLASTDMNFRPVNTATGPDGCLYIVDMYRGIIQESNWTREGSYLRPVIRREKLDKNFGRGRIYRLVYEGVKPGPTPDLLNKSTEELVEYLGHPNGWWRNTAQKLLIIRNDQAVVPALKKMATNDYSFFEKIFSGPEYESSALSKVHALWTLKGMNALDKEMMLQSLKDEDEQVRKTAVWLSEDYLKEKDAEVLTALAALKNDPSGDVRVQLALSLRYCRNDEAKALLKEIQERYPENKLLQAFTDHSLNIHSEPDFITQLKMKIIAKSGESRRLITKGAVIFKQLCSTCHGPDGKGVLNSEHKLLAPVLAGSKRVAGDKAVVTRILLHGLSGPVEGNTFPDVMPPMEANDDEWIASVISYIRYAYGNDSPAVRPDFIKEVRTQTAGRKKYWTLKELEKVEPTEKSSR